MKYIKKILFGILAIIVLLSVLILLYAFNPTVGGLIKGLINGQPQEVSEDTEDTEENNKRNVVDYLGVNEPILNATVKTPDIVDEPSEENNQSEDTGDVSSMPRYESSDNDLQGEIASPSIHKEYEAPSEDQIAVPDAVRGKNGYQVIYVEIIDEPYEEESSLDYGNTGDEYDFDPLFYPYYAMLNDVGKKVYRQIYANANDLYKAFKPVCEVNANEMKNIFSAVINDHPELFFVDTGYSGKRAPDGHVSELELRFNRTANDIASERARFEFEADKLISMAANCPNDYEKEKTVHNAIAEKVNYNLNAELNQSAYSAIVNDDTVCAGYAKAFQYVMQKLNIPCYYCVGYAGENHAWNIICLDRDFYNVDVTWDDTDVMTYDFFNKTDEDYSKDHVRREMAVYLPACNGNKYRNLEQNENAVANGLASISDMGIPEDAVFYDIDSYNAFCANMIATLGAGNHEFSCAVVGMDLLQALNNEYKDKSYREAYMREAMEKVDAKQVNMSIDIEELADDSYLILHSLSIR